MIVASAVFFYAGMALLGAIIFDVLRHPRGPFAAPFLTVAQTFLGAAYALRGSWVAVFFLAVALFGIWGQLKVRKFHRSVGL